ncbi:MAG: hypothetical protein VKJ02_18975 [Snowella sp.]|nr:hypothetical protein [Snowella sp.]
MKSGLKWLKSVPSPFISPQKRSLGFLLEFLLMTSAIALSAGIGFGAAIRYSQPDQTKLIRSEQSFPPRQDWPVSPDPSSTSSQNP